MAGKINVFYGSQVDIEGTVIHWENRTCFISAISQIWIGIPNKGKWGLTKDTENEGLNVELMSGSAFSFLSRDHDFLLQAYELLWKIVYEGGSKGKNTLDFENKLLQVYEEPEEPEEPEEETPSLQQTLASSGNHLVKQELLVLMEHCKKKKTLGTAVQQLLEEIIGCYDGTNSKELQELYKIFIQLSLINDCNELGLNLLIEEVKSRIYH